MELKQKYLHLFGGVDINPLRYKQHANRHTQRPNNARDEEEFYAVERAIHHGVPIIGVCRGAQLLCIKAGGSLWQHTDQHGGYHDLDHEEGTFPKVLAGHHQVMNLEGASEHEVLAWCPYPTFVEGENSEDGCRVLQQAPEVVWFPKIKALAVQPHPEWMRPTHEFRVWLGNVIEAKLGIQAEF